jgi:hypothetical protein
MTERLPTEECMMHGNRIIAIDRGYWNDETVMLVVQLEMRPDGPHFTVVDEARGVEAERRFRNHKTNDPRRTGR